MTNVGFSLRLNPARQATIWIIRYHLKSVLLSGSQPFYAGYPFGGPLTGWRATRVAMIDALLACVDAFDRSSFRVNAHEQAPGVAAGMLETTSLLANADFLVMETLFTELSTPAQDGHLVESENGAKCSLSVGSEGNTFSIVLHRGILS